MKEIIEGGITYIVTGNYPEVPYTKAVKTEVVEEKVAVKSLEEKVDELTAKIDALIKAVANFGIAQ